MDYTDISNMGEKELKELLSEKQQELQSLRFQAHEAQLKQTHLLEVTKKTISRILTLLTARKAKQ